MIPNDNKKCCIYKHIFNKNKKVQKIIRMLCRKRNEEFCLKFSFVE